jgi:hypothetical protein
MKETVVLNCGRDMYIPERVPFGVATSRSLNSLVRVFNLEEEGDTILTGHTHPS